MLRSRWANADVFPTEDTCVIAMRGQDVPAAGLGALVDPESEVRTHVRMLSAPVAPDRVVGYDSADALVWINPEPAQFTPAQVDALIREEVEKLGSREGGLMMIYGWYPGVPIENAKAVMDAMEEYATHYA